MKHKLNIAVIGLGNVGKEVINHLQTELKHNPSLPINITAVCDDKNPPTFNLLGAEFTDDYHVISTAENIDIVVECVNGAYSSEIIHSCLTNGKHVVSASSKTLALRGGILFALAADKGVQLRFEATVMGNVPCIENLSNISASYIKRIYGILDSSANYVITRMGEKGVSLTQASTDAIELGFASKNINDDISGKDTLSKLSLLRAAAFGNLADIRKIVPKGLEGVHVVDVRLARRLGYDIKLIGEASDDEIKVSPMLVDRGNMLGRTAGSMSGVVVETTNAGEMFFAAGISNASSIACGIISDIKAIIAKRKTIPVANLSKKIANPYIAKSHTVFLTMPNAVRENFPTGERLRILEEIVDRQTPHVGMIIETTMSQAELSSNLNNSDTRIWSLLA